MADGKTIQERLTAMKGGGTAPVNSSDRDLASGAALQMRLSRMKKDTVKVRGQRLAGDKDEAYQTYLQQMDNWRERQAAQKASRMKQFEQQQTQVSGSSQQRRQAAEAYRQNVRENFPKVAAWPSGPLDQTRTQAIYEGSDAYQAWLTYKRQADPAYQAAMKTVQEDQARGVKRTAQELSRQIDALELQIYDAKLDQMSYQQKVDAGQAPDITAMQEQLAALQARKTGAEQQSAIQTAEHRISGVDDETRGLLREYNEIPALAIRPDGGGGTTSRYKIMQKLLEKGYTEDEVRRLAEYEQRLQDYETYTARMQDAQDFGQRAPAFSTLISAAAAPFKALGNLESLRGVLPKGLGGYKNEGLPTNIYSPLYGATHVSSGIRGGVMQDMGATGQFLYQAGTSALDSAVNMAVSVGLMGAAGLSGEAAQGAVAETMNWVMGSQVAADSVYEGIRSGKSNARALVDGIAEGAIEGITEKHSVGEIMASMLSGKAAWKKLMRSFISEGGEEIASNWLNRLYDAAAHGKEHALRQGYEARRKDGMSESQAFWSTVKEKAAEDALSFLAGGISGVAMAGTYEVTNKVAGDFYENESRQSLRAFAEEVLQLPGATESARNAAQAVVDKINAGQTPTANEVSDFAAAAASTQPSMPATDAYDSYSKYAAERDAADAARAEEARRAREEVYKQENAGQISREEADQRLDALDEDISMDEASAADAVEKAAQDGAAYLDKAAQGQTEFEAGDTEHARQTVRQAGKSAGYSAQTQELLLEGFEAERAAGHGNAERYVSGFSAAYEYGQTGMSLAAAQKAAPGLTAQTARAAWSAGRENANNGTAGRTASYDGGKRNEGLDSQKPREGVAGRAGTAETEPGGRRAIQERIELENRVRAAGVPYRSGQEIGVTNGSAKKSFQEIPASMLTDSLRTIETQLKQAGATGVHFILGSVGVENPVTHVTRYAEGVTRGTEIWIRANASGGRTTQQIAAHEEFHLRTGAEEGFYDKAAAAALGTLSDAQLRGMANRYAEAYDGCYDASDLSSILDEILADAYAGINRRGAQADRLTKLVRDAVGQPSAGNQKTNGTRGPPERYSFALLKDGEVQAQAETMERDGKTPEEIWHELGVARTMDGKGWRYEIDDSGAEYNSRGDNHFRKRYPGYSRYQELLDKANRAVLGLSQNELTENERNELAKLKNIWGTAVQEGQTKGQALEDFLVHDDLFRAYPQLRGTRLEFRHLGTGENGYYDRLEDTIVLSEKLRRKPESTLLHEIQHAIQNIDKVPGGASPGYWNRRMEESYSRYENDGRIAKADKEYRRIFDNAPEAFKNKVREINRARLNRDYDAAESIVDELYDSEYAELWSRLDEADFARRSERGDELMPSDLYRNTAGEIEARDAAARRGLTAEDRRNLPPKMADEDTVFADRGWRRSLDYDPETASIKEQIENSRETLNKMGIVAKATVPMNLKNKDSAAAWATERLKSTGYRVDRWGYGEIYFDKKDIDKGLRYSDTAEEKAALAVLPQVLKRGIEIGGHANHKNRAKKTITFAAPVELNGQRGNMAAVVNKNGNHYYTHRIVTPDGKTFVFAKEDAAQELSRGVTVSGSLADTTSAASGNSIRNPEQKSQEKFSAAGTPAQGNTREQTQNEITDRYKTDVHNILSGESTRKGALLVGYTPELYRKLGMPDLPFVIGAGHVYSIAKTKSEAMAEGRFRKNTNYHGLGEQAVSDILRAVKDPVMVISAKDVDENTTPLRSTHSVVALVDIGRGGKTLVVPVSITAQNTVDGAVMDVNMISSAYKKSVSGLVDEAVAQFNSGERSIFYVTEKAATLTGEGVRFPSILQDAATSSDGIIRKLDSKINMSVKNVTQTQQFKRWFGDWQNHPETASKVVNENGTPKVVYHGTTGRFYAFDTREYNKNERSGDYVGEGFFFTDSRETARKYGSNVMAVYLNVKNPLVINTEADAKAFRESFLGRYQKGKDELRKLIGGAYDYFSIMKERPAAIRAELQRRGYDGLIDNLYGQYAVFNPEQVKSAEDNVGTFDRGNQDIRYSVSEETGLEDAKVLNLDTISQTSRKILMGQVQKAAEEAERKTPEVLENLTMETAPAKARGALTRVRNLTAAEIQKQMDIPYRARQDVIKPQLEALINEYLKNGQISQESIDRSFEKAYQEGRVISREFYDQYKDIKDQMRGTKITISEADKADIADFNIFRQQAFGRLRIANEGGLPIDTAYQSLREAAPELFPANLTHPADQLVKMLEVSRSIEITEQSLDEAAGGSAEEFRRWAKHDFTVSIDNMQATLQLARRYAEAQARLHERRAAGKPKTVEEVNALYKDLKDQRRTYERAMSRALLTEEDQRILNQLMRGDRSLEQLEGMENAEAIRKVYEAKIGYSITAAKIADWKHRIRAERMAEAGEALKGIDKAKDKAHGIELSRETMTRNNIDVFGEEMGERINKAYFASVRKAEAEAKRYKDRMRQRVREMDLSRKVEKGNAVSEAYAVQLLGEAEDNIRMLQERPYLKERDGKTVEEWNQLVLELWKQNPTLDEAKVRKGVADFRALYDELFQRINEVRVRNGYEPINYRSGYFPHFQVQEGGGIAEIVARATNTQDSARDSLLHRMGQALGFDTNVDELPTTIAGRTYQFKPGIRWFGNAQERKGFETAYDALEGFDRYIEGAAGVIFQTDNIQKLRALATQIRYLSSDAGLREQVDEVRALEGVSEEDKQNRIDKIFAEGQYKLSNYIQELDDYTNLLANKKSQLDRGMERMVGRSIYRLSKRLESRVAANMVALNPGSWLTNFGVIAQASAELKTSSVLKAMQQTLQSMKQDDGFVDASAFLTNRQNSDPLIQSVGDVISAKLSTPMEWIDMFSAQTIVRARYMENLQRGMAQQEAIDEADQFAADVMAERSKGGMPTMFESRNPITKLFTQFQLEVNNTFSYLFKDVPRRKRKEGIRALAVAIFRFVLNSWLYNELYEKIVGRRSQLDPIDLLASFGGDITGTRLNNLFDWAQDGVFTDGEPSGTMQTVKNLGVSLAQELPFVGNLADGGKLPFSSSLPNVGNIVSALDSDKLDAGTKGKKVMKELANPLAYWIPPFGGGQIKKLWQGIEAYRAGGSYTADGRLQYPIYTDRPGDNASAVTRTLLFGKSATEGAQAWVENGFGALSEKGTSTYEAIRAAGADQRTGFRLIQEISAAGKTDEWTKRQVQMQVLLSSSADDTTKALVYYGMIASDSEREKMDAYIQAGMDMSDYINFRDAASEVKSEKDADGKTIPNSKKKQTVELIDGTAFSPEQKTMLYEGSGYTATGFEPWTEEHKALAQAVKTGKQLRQTLQALRDKGYEDKDIRDAITNAFREAYLSAGREEQLRLRGYLRNAFVLTGLSDEQALGKIDGWEEEKN